MIGAGGTPGGTWSFLLGLAMAVVGVYTLTSQVEVTTAHWTLFGVNDFGLSLLPFLIGVGILFFDGGAKLGWLLAGLGLLIVLAGVLMNIGIYFRPTSLFNTLMMLGLIAGGLGLMARALRSGVTL